MCVFLPPSSLFVTGQWEYELEDGVQSVGRLDVMGLQHSEKAWSDKRKRLDVTVLAMWSVGGREPCWCFDWGKALEGLFSFLGFVFTEEKGARLIIPK